VRLDCPLCANRVISHRSKAAGFFGVSNEPPYSTSMPGAGAVHHINTGQGAANRGLNSVSNKCACRRSLSLLVCCTMARVISHPRSIEMQPEHQFRLFIVMHVIVWTLFATISYSSGSLFHDMTETWAWGKEFQLGYYKHPPFYAWVTGLWFQVFPRQDWCFFLLSAVNVAVGLTGVWFLAGRFLAGWTRLAAVLLLAFVPFYNLEAIKFNANAILLSTWPWTAYFFIRSIDSGTMRQGALFGATAAISLLSKYFSLYLLACCLIAALLHPDARKYFRSSAPYAAVAVCALMVAPHIWWEINQDWPALHYASKQIGYPYFYVLYHVVNTVLICMAYQTIAVAAVFVCFRNQTVTLLGCAARSLLKRENLWLVALAFGPFVLTLLSGIAGAIISTRFMIPVFFMMPIAILSAAPFELTLDRFQSMVRIAKVLAVVVLVASPGVTVGRFVRQRDTVKEPRRELAVEVTRLWHEAFGIPLRIASASEAYGHAIAFYSVDAPSEFTDLRSDRSPWITPARIAAEGLLVACIEGDQACIVSAQLFSNSESERTKIALARTFFAWRSPPVSFEVFMIPPRRPAAS
jgi:Dolichyl-phosphate-mannose-protein mannosyltransferase